MHWGVLTSIMHAGEFIQPAAMYIFELYRMKRLFFLGMITGVLFLLLKAEGSISAVNDKQAAGDTLKAENLLYPELVNKFYQLKGDSLFWFASGNDAFPMRQQLLRIIDSSRYYGLIAKPYHYTALVEVLNTVATDSAALIGADRLYTDAAIAVCKDIYQGYKMLPWVGYDQLSEKYNKADNDFLIVLLLQTYSAAQLQRAADLLEPVHATYSILKQELRREKEKNANGNVVLLQLSLNYLRWIHHFRFEQFIIINLPAASLQYFEKDTLVLQMKTVVGKSSTPSPRFATYCDMAIMYPYWYVPGSILFKEYLPKMKANPSWLDAHGMQVVDGKGKVLNHHQLNWSAFHSGYFPYILRQSTGCDNALGILKFNINTPYGVYLHDTNNKTAFLSASRFYSHGCIRLEDPLALGNRLLAGKLDTNFLQSCFKEQKPVPVLLKKPVPVFSVYMPVTVDAGGKVYYYKDVYKLMKK
jgi:L,D-transpeptidase YcbB